MKVMWIISTFFQAVFLFQTNYPQRISLISRYLLWLSVQSNELSKKLHNYYFLILVLIFGRSSFGGFPLMHYIYSLRYTIPKIRYHISRNVFIFTWKVFFFLIYIQIPKMFLPLTSIHSTVWILYLEFVSINRY